MSTSRLNSDRYFAAYSPYIDERKIIPYIEVDAAYSDSKYGQYHSRQKLRWSKFYYGREKMLQDIGDDAHPVKHMFYTYSSIVTPFMKSLHDAGKDKHLSPLDIKAIRLAALTHDIGECEYPDFSEICGDIEADYRTEDNARVERNIRLWVIEDVLSFLPDDLIFRTEEIIMKSPFDDTSKIFNLNECSGYFESGIRAGTNLIQEGVGPLTNHRARQLGKMAVQVVDRQLPLLQSEAHKYPYVKKVISDTQEVSHTILTRIRQHVVI